MIQRIQSVYLLVAAILVLVVPFTPTGITLEEWSWYGAARLALAIAVAAASVLAIFLYGDRKRQKGVVTVDLVLAVLLAALVVAVALFAGVTVLATVWPFFPAVAAALLIALARRAISRDIELVRSMDRLR